MSAHRLDLGGLALVEHRRAAALSLALLAIVLSACVTSPPADLAPGSARPSSSPEPPRPPVTPMPAPALTTVHFVDRETGWLGGSRGIYGTMDGGQHWTRQADADDVLSFHFLDARQGWAVTPARLLGTEDGGQSWQELGEPDQPLRSVSFINADIGWGVAGGDKLFRRSGTAVPDKGGRLTWTTDGGRTWTSAYDPKAVPAQSICFGAPKRGWLATGPLVFESVGFETHAVGWTGILLQRGIGGFGSPTLPSRADPPESAVQNTPSMEEWYGRFYSTVRCAGEGTVLITTQRPDTVMGHNDNAMAYTVDRGAHWRSVGAAGCMPGPFVVVGSSHIFYAAFPCPVSNAVPLLTVWIDGDPRPHIYPIGNQFLYSPYALTFPDPQHGWFLGHGSNGEFVLLMTVDGGQAWVPMPLP